MRELLELLRRLGEAFFELVAAEAGALAADLRRNGREALKLLLLVATAAVLVVLAWALVTLALVWGLATVLAPWQAALAVGGLYLVAAVACALLARARWRAIEAPTDTVRRRLRDQGTWFRERILALPPEQVTNDDR